MFPSFEVHFLYEEQRHRDEIRQIQLENELRRAYRKAKPSRNRSWGILGLLAERLSAFAQVRGQQALESEAKDGLAAGSPEACPDPCFAA
jgi:hypothetical protein